MSTKQIGLKQMLVALATVTALSTQAQSFDEATSRLTLPTLVIGNLTFSNVVLRLNSVDVISFQGPQASAQTTKTCQLTTGTVLLNVDKSARRMSGTYTANQDGVIALYYMALIQNGTTYNLSSGSATTPTTISGTLSGGPAIAQGTSVSFTLDAFPASFDFGGSFTLYEALNGSVRSCS